MKTILLLTHSGETQHQLNLVLGQHISIVPLTPPTEPGREAFDKLFVTWLRLADGVFLDAASLGETARWGIESLATAGTPAHLVVVARMTTQQQQLYRRPGGWLVLADTEPFERAREIVSRCFELHDAQTRLQHLEDFRSRQPQPALVRSAELPGVAHRYREALKGLSATLGQQRERSVLLTEFARLLRELLGVGRLALFVRGDGAFTVVASTGIKAEVVRHFRLAALPEYLAREGRVLRRAALAAPWAFADAAALTREFDLLGTEVAVPMLDNEQQLRGVLTLAEKVAGEPLSNDELELVYHLLEQLARTLERDELIKQAEAQRQFYTDVLTRVQTGVLIVGPDHRIVSLNPRVAELLGVTAADCGGQPLTILPACVADVVFEAMLTKQPVPRREVTLPRGARVLGMSVSYVESGRGPVAVALVDDLTELKRQQLAAHDAQEKEFFTRVAYRLSHELKNSLVSIKIFGQLLPERYQEKEFREQFSTIVVSEVNRVDVLVNNLTFFSQPLALVHEEFSLTEVLEACVKNVTQEFSRKQSAFLVAMGETPPEPSGNTPVIVVKRSFAHQAPRVDADRIRVIQAVEHVLRNGVQWMPKGGRLLISTTEAVATDFAAGQLPAGGAVRIDIQDTGEGIALNLLPRITEPFVTTRNVGVGLGLTIVKKIVERHSGRLLIESMLGQGTKVSLVLPVKMQAHPDDKLVTEAARGSSAEELFRSEEDPEAEAGMAAAMERRRRGTSASR